MFCHCSFHFFRGSPGFSLLEYLFLLCGCVSVWRLESTRHGMLSANRAEVQGRAPLPSVPGCREAGQAAPSQRPRGTSTPSATPPPGAVPHALCARCDRLSASCSVEPGVGAEWGVGGGAGRPRLPEPWGYRTLRGASTPLGQMWVFLPWDPNTAQWRECFL